ncbi:MAG: DUF222 domain-containing protein [Actinobacteria bacterium]|nr:DUF222 domain-containing protein [Actinomycetota bacterium]
MSTTPTAPSESVSAGLAGLRALDDQEVTDELHAVERQIRELQARRALVVTEVVGRIEAIGGPVSGAADELGLMLSISSRSADNLAGTSVDLSEREVVWEGLRDGRIDLPKAQCILRELQAVPDPRREELELIAVGFAEHHTAHQLKSKLLAMTCDNDPEAEQREEALRNRGVWFTPRGHGMTDVHAYLSAEQAEAFAQALDGLAESPECPDPHGQGDQRTLAQRRADALSGFLDQHTTWDITAQVLIPADMLVGVETTGAELNGSPCTHELASLLAWSPDARWQRLVTDPLTGTLLDAGTRKYEIPERLRKAVRLRDRTCRFPGCTRRAEYTDTDHVVPWPEGTTRAQNLVCLCRRHHRLKTFGRWQVASQHGPAHDLTWTGPLGTARTTRPHGYHRRD